MKNICMAALTLIATSVGIAQPPDYLAYPVYAGNDLGVTWQEASTRCRLWAPSAEAVKLHLYKEGAGGSAFETIDLQKAGQGTWQTTLQGNRHGVYYTFQAKINGKWMSEVPDPYTKAAGINGKRGMIINMAETHPPGWEKDVPLPAITPTDAIVYELHVRDASIHPSSGIVHKGKYLAFTEKNSKNPAGAPTLTAHLQALGITHVHLLPVFDFSSVDESKPEKLKYNWGYDPLNYNVPEGSYSTNAANGEVRIKEFKQMVMALHQAGIRVVMDVVYNHTATTDNSVFNQVVPGYYYRQNTDGRYSNASACGNETASERPMMRKFMMESLLHWVKEYHIDGFRFDLMGIHDIETMNAISAALNEVKPGILLYGEGWTAGPSPLPEERLALKKNVARLQGIAAFSDDIRDGIKGSVFNHEEKGFATGNTAAAESVKFGVVASCPHPQVNMEQVNYSKQPYATSPAQVMTYCECHDNHVLWDRIALSNPQATEAQRRQMYQLALGIVLTSQGISFLHAGTEFYRTKHGVENSFESPDSINAIDWGMASRHAGMVKYLQQLITLRKTHPAFRLTNASLISESIHFEANTPESVVAYTIDGSKVGDTWKKILVVYHGGTTQTAMAAPAGSWKSAIRNNSFSKGKAGKQLTLAPSSLSVFYIAQ